MTARETPDKDGFLTRWSRLKRGTEDNDRDPESADANTTGDGAATLPAESERADEMAANRAAAEAVDLDSIDYESDLSVFFKEGVPAVLKQAALRKMWRSDPVFANLDGLNDYDQDFNVIDKVLTEFKSAWQVGRGYASQADEELAPEDAESAETAANDAEAPEEASVETAEAPTSEPGQTPDADEAEVRPPAGAIGSPPLAPGDAEEAQDNGNQPVQEEPVRPTVSLRRRMQLFDDGES